MSGYATKNYHGKYFLVYLRFHLSIIIWCWTLLVRLYSFEYLCRRGSPLAHIPVLFHVILGSAPLAKCLWNGLVTVVLWSMFSSAYTTTACQKRSKWLSAHVVDPVTGNIWISLIACEFVMQTSSSLLDYLMLSST